MQPLKRLGAAIARGRYS